MPYAVVARPYRYYHKEGQRGWWIQATREEWLAAVGNESAHPKAPEWWLTEQLTENRTRQQAAIIWGSRYNGARKQVIWDQASEEDFRMAGYL